MKSILLCYCFLFLGFTTKGVSQSVTLPDSIEHYAHELIRNHDLEVRENAFEYLNDNLGEFIGEYANFQDSFPRFEGLAVLENKEIQLRIITYQFYRDTSSYEYGGWVQMEGLEDAVFLSDASGLWEEDQDLEYMELDPANWYGALYYQMHPVTISQDKVVMILFGLDNYHLFTKRKVLETMVVDKNGVHFGQSMIEMEEGLPRDNWKKRFILDYSVQAPATLRYDPDRGKIIFDHLTFMPSNISRQRIMRVPDGTYSGFEIDQKVQKLVFIEKVFDQVLEEAPAGRDEPEVKRDLFGNPERN